MKIDIDIESIYSKFIFELDEWLKLFGVDPESFTPHVYDIAIYADVLCGELSKYPESTHDRLRQSAEHGSNYIDLICEKFHEIPRVAILPLGIAYAEIEIARRTSGKRAFESLTRAQFHLGLAAGILMVSEIVPDEIKRKIKKSQAIAGADGRDAIYKPVRRWVQSAWERHCKEASESGKKTNKKKFADEYANLALVHFPGLRKLKKPLTAATIKREWLPKHGGDPQ